MNAAQRKLSTLNINLSAFFEFHGIPTELEINNVRVVFTLQINNALCRSVNVLENLPLSSGKKPLGLWDWD